jgi:hypothetical protein
MTRYIRATEVAKLARAALKEAFPGQKFSVRTAHGTTLQISWTDGPATHAVNEVVDRFAGEGFDGMTDMRYSRENGGTTPDGEPIRYLTDFVFCTRELSPEVEAALTAEISNAIAIEQGIRHAEVWINKHRYWPAPQVIMQLTDHGWQDASVYQYVRILAEARAQSWKADTK